METLEPNGERGRSEPQKRRGWASALMRPQTVKVLLSWLAALLSAIRVFHEIIKIFRQ